jgi:hypothetical protein
MEASQRNFCVQLPNTEKKSKQKEQGRHVTIGDSNSFIKGKKLDAKWY